METELLLRRLACCHCRCEVRSICSGNYLLWTWILKALFEDVILIDYLTNSLFTSQTYEPVVSVKAESPTPTPAKELNGERRTVLGSILETRGRVMLIVRFKVLVLGVSHDPSWNTSTTQPHTPSTLGAQLSFSFLISRLVLIYISSAQMHRENHPGEMIL